MNEKKINVLLIEDNPGDVRLIREMLAGAYGVTFDLECKNNLSTGLKRINIGGIDVVLLDLSLPDSQGLDTFIELHTHTPELPIVVLSGLDDEEVAVKAVQEGAQDYLVKARVDSDLLVRSIRYSIERKQAEEALRTSEEKYRVLVENANEAIVVAQDGVFKFFNPKTMEITGFSMKELSSKPFVELIHPEDKEMVVDRHLRRLKGEKLPHIYLFRIIDNERNVKWMEINAVLIDWEGRPATLNFLNDITERKQAEDQLIQSEKLAGIGILASGIAHEINNPLTGIMGYAEILQDGVDQDRTKNYIKRIIDNTQRASKIVKWLTKYSREAKDSNIKDINLLDVINDSLEAIIHTRKSCDISIDTDFQKMAAIKGNRSELQQVFVNLLNNAVDALPNGGMISLSNQIENGFIKINVSDNGIGIPKEFIKKIFDPFFTTKEVGEGTGLGLYVSSMIVKKHHGTMEVESEEGRGTTFSMRFPISEVNT